MALTEDSTLGQIWRSMRPELQERLFFFLLRAVEFYGHADTWFAVMLVPDPPAGLIMSDDHWCEGLNRRAAGGRARVVLSWVQSAFRRAIEASQATLPEKPVAPAIQLYQREYHGFEDFSDYWRDVHEAVDADFNPAMKGIPGEFQGKVTVTITYEPGDDT